MGGRGGGWRGGVGERLRGKDIEQGGTLSELAAKIDDPAIGHHAIADATAGFEACKFHGCCVRWLVDISQLSLPGLGPGNPSLFARAFHSRRLTRGSSPRMTLN